jgi:hypothetical protein
VEGETMKEIPGGKSCQFPDDDILNGHECPFYSSNDELDELCSWFDKILNWHSYGPDNRCPECLTSYPNGGVITIEAKP